MSSNTRPLLTYAILVVIVMAVLGILLAQLTRGYFLNIFEDRIEVESQYFTTYLELFSEDNNISEEELYSISNELNTQVVFLTEDGQIMIDTVDTGSILSLEEKNKIINQVRNEENINQEGDLVENTFYFPTEINYQNTQGTLIFISPVESLQNVTKNIWLLVGMTLLIGLAAIFLIGFNVFSKYIQPIRSSAAVAKELVRGNYKARTYEGDFGEGGQLSQSINILAQNLQEMTSTKGMQENQLEAVINNMGNGLVLIDEKGYILLVNRAFLKTFGGESKEYINYLYYDAIPYTTIHETVQKVYMFEETISETFVLPVKIDRIHLDVTGAPIFSENKKWKGIVLVFHDISDLKQLEQMRKDFVANVSHELKTPITSIRGFSETLLDGALKDEAMLEEFLRIILKESGRLQSLIQDLLELSKLEKEDFQLTIETVNLKLLLDDLLPIVNQYADKKGVHIHTKFDGESVLQGDAGRLKQVFMNLLTNAINYTASNGEVILHLKELKNHLHIAVSDNGVGIPEEEVSRIFERFYRVDKARSRNSGGTGLGLAIVKHIIEGHHGEIEVESAIDKGTTFYLKLPKDFTQN